MTKKSRNHSSKSDLYNYLPFILLLPLLLLPPFFRGLFFDRELLIAHIYSAVVLITYILIRRDNFRINLNLMEASFIGLTMAFLLATFNAFHLRDAVGEFLKIVNYLLVFLLVSRLASDLKKMQRVLEVFFIAGAGVALAGIGTAFGTFWFNGAYVGGLINSTLQYHNGNAIFLMACGIIGLYISASAKEPLVRYAVSGINFLVLITAFGAGSRGAMLMAPLAFVVFFIGMPAGIKGKSFLSLASISIPFVLLAQAILNFQNPTLPWLYLFAGMLISSLIHYGLEKGLRQTKVQIDTKKLMTGLAAGFLMLGTVVFLFSDKLLPPTISDRLHNFTFEQRSVQERLYFYKDSTNIIKENPVFGSGGGGWNASYRQYQSYLYHSTEVHNHPLQIWVEGGTVAFIFYVMLWLGGIIAVFKIVRSGVEDQYKAVIWTASGAALALGLHSIIDFSLSEGAISILLWSQFGLIRAVQIKVDKEPKVLFNSSPVLRTSLGILLGGALLISSLVLYTAEKYSNEAAAAAQVGSAIGIRDNLEKAIKFDPMHAGWRLQLAQVYAYQAAQSNNIILANKALNEAEKAIELNRTSAESYLVASQVAVNARNIDKMIKYAQEAVKRAPLRQDVYDNLAMTYLYAGRIYAANKEVEKAEVSLQKIFEIPAEMEQVMASKNQLEKSLWLGQHLKVSEKMQSIQDEAKRLLTMQ